MRFSYWAGTGDSWSEILDDCRHAESAGWDGIWVADHFMPQPPDPTQLEPADSELGPMLEAWTLLSALAASVPRVRLGVIVTGITYRHPAVLANMACTVDHVAGGRLVLGVGAGWQLNEHRRYGIELGSPGERSDRFEEACEVLTSLLSQERTTVAGRWFRLDDAPCEPKPVQDRLPLLIGGAGEKRTLRTVARFADEWNVWGDPGLLAHKMAVLDAHCDTVGRDPASISRSAAAFLVICDDAARSADLRSRLDARGGLVGTVDELRARLDEYEAIGVDELVVPGFNMTSGDRRETLDRFRAEVIDRR